MNVHREKAPEATVTDGVEADRASIENVRPFNFSFHILEPHDPNFEWGKEVERKVFGEEFGDDLETLEDEYGPYDPHSTLLVVYDEKESQPVGMWRVIHQNDEVGFKTVNDVSDPHKWSWHADFKKLAAEKGVDVSSSQTVDLGSVAMLKDYRGGAKGAIATVALYKGFLQYAEKNQILTSIGIIDRVPYERVVCKRLGGIFKPFEGLEWGEYLGSKESRPVFGDINEIPRIIQAHDPNVYKVIIEARALEGAVTFPDGLFEE